MDRETKERDETRAEITAEVQRWMDALDRGDLEGLIACCDDRLLVANQGRATVRGPASVREKYAPIISAFTTRSRYEVEDVVHLGDTAFVSGTFATTLTPKDGGPERSPSGRLLLGYARQPEGGWKLVLDIDNNAA